MPKSPVDYSWVGPTVTCPGCQSAWFQTALALDPDTNLPGVIGLDATCLGCGASVKLATPLDEVAYEPSHEERSGAD